MKKVLFSLMALAAIAAGCSKSEVLNAPGAETPIAFETYLGRTPVTKATSVTTETLQKSTQNNAGFHVYAFLHIEDATIDDIVTTTPYMSEDVWYVPSESDSDGKWDYEGVAYWPDATSGRKLAFSAYGLVDGISISADQNNTSLDFTVSDEVSEQQDLIATAFISNKGIGTDGTGTTVNLEFKHLLSRVGFSLMANNDEADINIDIHSVVLNGTFPKSGSINLKTADTPVITPATSGETAGSYSLFSGTDACTYTSSTTKQPIFANATKSTDNDKIVAKENADANNRYMMIIPSEQDNATIVVTYQLTEGQVQTATIKLPENWNFEAGKSYDFVLKISTSAIGFSVVVEGWNEIEEETTLVPSQTVDLGNGAVTESGSENA